MIKEFIIEKSISTLEKDRVEKKVEESSEKSGRKNKTNKEIPDKDLEDIKENLHNDYINHLKEKAGDFSSDQES